MKITCPGCGWSAEIPKDKIPAQGTKGTCPKCQITFEVKKEDIQPSDFTFETPKSANTDTQSYKQNSDKRPNSNKNMNTKQPHSPSNTSFNFKNPKIKYTGISIIVLLIFFSIAVATDIITLSVKNLKITENNKDKITEKIIKSNSLKQEEKELFVTAMMRNSIGGMLGAEKNIILGKTVGEVIEDQKNFAIKQKAEEERQKQEALKEKARQDALVAELTKTISILPYDVKHEDRGYMDGMSINFTTSNTSDKDIRAFEGRLKITDILGGEVANIKIESLMPIKAGEKRNDSSSFPFMLYGTARGKKFEDLKFKWEPKTIILVDGTVLGEQPKK